MTALLADTASAVLLLAHGVSVDCLLSPPALAAGAVVAPPTAALLPLRLPGLDGAGPPKPLPMGRAIPLIAGPPLKPFAQPNPMLLVFPALLGVGGFQSRVGVAAREEALASKPPNEEPRGDFCVALFVPAIPSVVLLPLLPTELPACMIGLSLENFSPRGDLMTAPPAALILPLRGLRGLRGCNIAAAAAEGPTIAAN